MTKTVLTIATGKVLYLDLAINLARSFYYWNKDEEIAFYLATDMPGLIPDDTKAYINVIRLKEGEFGKGFSPKLHLDKLAPPGQTLFIDSDCLVYGKLTRVFEAFQGHAVSVIGRNISSGEWFGNVGQVCSRFNITGMPKFNGGVYYIENGDKAKQLYDTARQLEKQYDEIGFVRLRNRPNDEVIMAAAMAIHKETAIPEDGTIMAEFVNFRSGIYSDVLTGKVTLFNTPGKPDFQEHWPLHKARPLIVHYLAHYNEMMPYIKEKRHLEYIMVNKYSTWMLRSLTFLQTSLPWLTKHYLKESLRPLYRLLIGTRKVKKSERVINS